MKKIFGIVGIVLIVGVAYSQSKIAPEVLRKSSNGGQVDVIVIIKSKNDLRSAKMIKNKTDKGRAVYEKLYAECHRSQHNVIGFLEDNSVDFRSFYIVNAVALSADKDVLERLAEFEEVDRIIYDHPIIMEEPLIDNGILSRATEWGIRNINADDVWAIGINGSGAVIGGQDTGYEWDHAAIKGKYRGWNGITADHDYHWHDAIHTAVGNPCGADSSIPCDDHSHGTHTMGTMAGDDGGTNQVGVAPGAKWIGCRNMDEGNGTLSTYVECFEWFLAPYPVGTDASMADPAKAPDVINNSWSCPTSEGCNSSNWGLMDTAVNNLRAAGVVVVVSAGNSGSGCSTVSTPAAIFDGSFSVGASNSSNVIASFSSRGPVTVDGSNRLKPDITAPGVSVRSSVRGGGYATWNGTSMAGPHVAGTVALMISANPALAGQVDQIESIIINTARPKTTTQTCGGIAGSEVPNNTYGYGIIDALAAVQESINLLPIELIHFDAELERSYVALNWSTASEVNNFGFYLQRSKDGDEWDAIHFEQGQLNSQVRLNYDFRDVNPLTGISYYRLLQKDIDGTQFLSNVEVISNGVDKLEVQLYPNPSDGTIQMNIQHSEQFDALTVISIHNALGQLVDIRESTQDFEKIELNQGIYSISVYADGSKIHQEKLIVY